MSRVVVRSLTPDGLHGFVRGELALTELGDGLNVVYAPNAAGKSTLARALGLLLNPGDAPPDVIIAGHVDDGSGPTPRQVRKKDREYPGFRGNPRQYSLDLLSLVEGFGKGERELLARVIGEGVSTDPGTPPRLSTPVSELDALDRELKSQRARSEHLVLEEARLPELERRTSEAKAAGEELKRLQSIRAYRELVRRLEEARAARCSLIEAHPGLERQDPGAADGTRVRYRALQEARKARVEAEKQLGPDAALDDAALTAGRMTDAELGQLEAQVRGWDQLMADVHRAEDGLREANAKARALREGILQLTPDEDPDALPTPAVADVEAATSALRREDARAAAQRKRDAAERLLTEWRIRRPAGEPPPTELLDALKAWLECEAPAAEIDRRPLLLVGIAGGGAVLVAIAGAAGWQWIAVGAVAAAAVAVFMLGAPRLGPSRAAELLERIPAEVRGPAPDRRSILAAYDARQRGSLTLQLASEMAAEIERFLREPLPESEWPALAERLRLRLADPFTLEACASRLREYEAARVEVERRRAVLEEALDRRNRRLEEVRTELARFDFSAPEAFSELDGAQWVAAFSRRREACRRWSAARDSVRELADLLAQFLDAQGVPCEEDLDARVGCLEARAAAATELAMLASRSSDLEQALQQHRLPETGEIQALLGASLDEVTDEELEAGIARRESAQSDLETLTSEAATIREQLRAAEHSREALQLDERLQRLTDTQTDAWREHIRKWMFHQVRLSINENLRDHALPGMVREASSYLDRFTGGRYRLRFGRHSDTPIGRLEVYDERRGVPQAFAELSTGTRLHVVLALRLGLLTEQEGGVEARHFPIVADEVMAVSDPEASRALAEALVQIAAERQVILFTNQPEDVSLLRELCPEVQVKTFGPEPEFLPQTPVELPGYRRPPGVRSPHPLATIRAHHPEALFPETVHRKLEPVDSIEELLETGSLAPELRAYLELLEACRQELLRQRPRLVWEQIQRAEWVTPTYRESIREIVREERGDGARCLERIERLPSIRATTKQSARDWLEAHGYLEPPVTLEEVRRVVADRAPEGMEPFHQEHAAQMLLAAFAEA